MILIHLARDLYQPPFKVISSKHTHALYDCATLLPECIIRRFKHPHIQASRLKSWMFCYTGHLDLLSLFNFMPYLPYFMTTYAFGDCRHRPTHSTPMTNFITIKKAWLEFILVSCSNYSKRQKVNAIQLSHTHTKKTITSLCCQDDLSHFRFRPPGFVVAVHHLANSARLETVGKQICLVGSLESFSYIAVI